jgi:hypothetical protein
VARVKENKEREKRERRERCTSFFLTNKKNVLCCNSLRFFFVL